MRAWQVLALTLPLVLDGTDGAAPATILAPSRAVAPGLAAISTHENTRPAGRLRDGVLTVALEIRRGMWHPNGPDRPGTPMLVFAEPGGEATIPGPMLRVPLGTAVVARLHNASDSVIVVRGLAGASAARDSVVLAPGAHAERRFVADVPGDHIYYGALPGRKIADRRVEDGHLAGAFIVDPGPRPAAERGGVAATDRHAAGRDAGALGRRAGGRGGAAGALS